MSKSSPRPWGCFLVDALFSKDADVFPTPVGVFLKMKRPHAVPTCLPHARGGVSVWPLDAPDGGMSSPRPWGCF